MLWDADNERDERKIRFIELMKKAKSDELLIPLSEKLAAYGSGEASPEEAFSAASFAGRKGEALIADFKKRPDVILAGIAMDENRYLTAIGEIGISVRLAEVTGVFSDAIINPVFSDGSPAHPAGESVAAGARADLLKEISAELPLKPGSAAASGAGEIPAARVIHACVAEKQGESTVETVRSAVSSALAIAEELDLETLALPGAGSGPGGLAPGDAAAAVIGAVSGHDAENVTRIILLDTDDEVTSAFTDLLEKIDEEDQ